VEWRARGRSAEETSGPHLIHEVVVDVDAEAGEIILVIHWKGGVHTELRLPRRRRGQNRNHTSPEIVQAVRTLAHICSDDLLANALNRSGQLTGRGNRWTRRTSDGASHASRDPLLRS
jgi:hypothetical protein